MWEWGRGQGGAKQPRGDQVTGPKEREGRSAGTPVSTEPPAWLYNTEFGSVQGKSHSPLPLLECPERGHSVQ